MVELQHLSYSSISTYQLCPEAWRRKYIAGEREATSVALLFGSAAHDAIEHYIAGRQPLDVLWREKLTQQVQQAADIDWGTDTLESLTDEGLRILGAPAVATLINSVRDGYDANRELSIERRIELRVPGVPIPIIGYVDIISADGVPGDFKTAARMWPENKAAQELQPLVYLAALNQAGINDHNWRFRHYVITKSAKPSAKVFECQRSAVEVLTGLFPTIQQTWIDIQAERFPKNTTTWKCSPRYCGYYADCQGGG